MKYMELNYIIYIAFKKIPWSSINLVYLIKFTETEFGSTIFKVYNLKNLIVIQLNLFIIKSEISFNEISFNPIKFNDVLTSWK